MHHGFCNSNHTNLYLVMPDYPLPHVEPNYPAFVKHTLAVYDALQAQATLEKDPEYSDIERLIFTGLVSHVFGLCNVSMAHYSRIMRVLKEVEAIAVLQRGTRYQPSVIEVRGRPDPERFADENLTKARHLATLVAAVEKRLDLLEAFQLSVTAEGTLNVMEALRNHETRLAHLEGKAKEPTEPTRRVNAKAKATEAKATKASTASK